MVYENDQRYKSSAPGIDRTSRGAATLPKRHEVRAAVLGLFREPPFCPPAGAWDLSPRQWRRLLRWLDTSGLALYFLKRVTELEIQQSIPSAILARLRVNLRDNLDRLEGMVQEAASIRSGFEAARLTYAVSKGFSLWPDSVPHLELRSQLDLDFVLAEADAAQARHQLEQRAYVLCAISGRTWEFKTPVRREITLADLYKSTAQFCVELHLQPAHGSHLLQDLHRHMHAGVPMPVLSPVDIFVAQAGHLFKHLSRDAMRTSHLLEFYRHLLARNADPAFWKTVARRLERDPKTQLALSAVLYLVSQEFSTPLQDLTRLPTIASLPPGIRLWIERYGSEAVYADFPGNKFHLLLRREIEQHGGAGARSLRARVFPLGLPPAIEVARPGETNAENLRRYCKQIWYVGFRARFHLCAGLQYALERPAWKRAMAREDAAAAVASAGKQPELREGQQSGDIPLTGV